MNGVRGAGLSTSLVAAALTVSACATHAGGTGRRITPSLATYIGQVRALSAAARPVRHSGFAESLETWDPRLAIALRDLAREPGADQHCRVAQEYRRLGVLDAAHRHFSAAVQLNPRDAAAHDGLARIWRDWGFPNLGLDDAYRAAQLAPESPVAANTVGTLLAATERFGAAREWYARALLLDPGAGYALTNLCYAHIIMGRRDARAACERAFEAAPELGVARNNLGLAYASEGDIEKAREVFARADTPGTADYNLGIVYMARQEFRKATDCFAAAARANPRSGVAAARERQARARDRARRNDRGE